MTGKTVSQYSSEEFLPNGTSTFNVNGDEHHDHYTSMQVATTVTFAVATFQVI